MRQIALFVSAGFALSGAAYPAEYRVEGDLDAWRLWHFASDTVSAGCNPPYKVCIESTVPPAPVSQRAGFRIPVSGRARIVRGKLVDLSLRQSAPVSLHLAGGGSGGRLKIRNLRWQLRDGRLAQRGGAIASCGPSSGPGCRSLANGINDPATRDSMLDFDGIPDQFPIQLGAVRLNHRPPFAARIRGNSSISIDVASHARAKSPLSPLFNAAGVAHFTLAVAAGTDRSRER